MIFGRDRFPVEQRGQFECGGQAIVGGTVPDMAAISRTIDANPPARSALVKSGKAQDEHIMFALPLKAEGWMLAVPRCSGGFGSEHFWIDGPRLRAATKAPQRGRGRAAPERCSSICSSCCQLMVGIPGGGS
jgi:hypothetical protein